MRATFVPCSCGPATGKSRKPSRSSVPTAAVRSAPGIWPRIVSRDDERVATETVRPGGSFHAQTMPELWPAAGCLAHRDAHGALRVAYCLVYGPCGASPVARRLLYCRVRRAFAPCCVGLFARGRSWVRHPMAWSRCLRVVRPHVALALSAVLLHARRAPGQHREGRQAEPGPVARHGGCARRAAQRATRNGQHATCS